MAWLSGYGERCAINVLAAKVGSGGVTNFPVLLTGANMPAALWADALASGLDLRVTAADGETKVNHELVSFTPGSSLMELHFLGASLSSSVATTFYLYWKKPGDTGEVASWAQGVWTPASYVGLWHLSGNISVVDSVGNADGTNYNVTSAAGVVGNCGVFDGTAAYISLPNVAALNITGNLSMEAWIKGSGTSTDMVIGGYSKVSPYNGYSFALNYPSVGKMGYWNGAGSWTGGNSAVNTGQWKHVAVTVNGTTAAFFVDGVADGTPADGVPNSYAGLRAIGQESDSGAHRFAGSIDEVRISTAVRSVADLLTSYNNQSSPSTFYTVGAVETAGGIGPWLFCDYSHYRRMRRF